jgi:FMN phosphatase YigB (HAD superfamily)
MRLTLLLASLTLSVNVHVHAFAPNGNVNTPSTSMTSQRSKTSSVAMTATVPDQDSSSTKPTKTKKLSLITFDLDDTLYPVATVLSEANAAFARSMKQFGYTDIEAEDIVSTGKKIRDEMAKTDPEGSATLTHTEIRRLAIRKEMEKIEYQRKLQSCADDWATQVSSLSPLVVNNAKKWASTAVSPQVVEAVLSAWEMERHHGAERHLYPDVVNTLQQIKSDHPNVIIGAVTDGKANPLFMTFTLAKYFDYCINWEDDQAGRKKFFTDLSNVEKDADLRWIYNAAREKGEELAETQAQMREDEPYPRDDVEYVWIHVGDDLALDVGGSATCGAKTILAELADKQYHQTARHRFDNVDNLPDWSTTPKKELLRRQLMNKAAEELVDKKVAFISHIPEAINNILEDE